ncbi:dUTP diphosphatase [Paenilisteria newyorkensis]|uniref:dUTP diphosphatase n=1 Tax=Listeria newyorkensis TaxID=1497681 RepID=UPI00235A0DE3|nr:dUTP diphosphatase [Listeria newyorkensis]WAO22056.1 dUTP diphosphatase [Listeria newyorkensis]
MNIEKMLEMQTQVDAKIMEKVDISSSDLEGNLYLALLVEMGEFANEIQDFKHWKHSKAVDMSKVKDELADCLAFTFALLNHNNITIEQDEFEKNLEELNNIVELRDNMKDDRIGSTFSLFESIYELGNDMDLRGLLYEFIVFGNLALGLSLEEIEKAYMDKAKVNIERQEEGY